MNGSPESTPASTDSRDAVALVQAIGQSLNVALLYGMGHKVTLTSLERSGAVLVLFLDIYGHLDINVAEGTLLVNGTLTESPLAGALAARLASHNLLSFEIGKGFTLAEYVALFTLLVAAPAQAGGTAVSQLNEAGTFPHIQARSIEYRRVAGGEAEPGSAPTPAATVPGTPLEGSRQPPDLDNILAFLKDEPQADPQRSTDDIRQLGGDAEKLAELILRTVEVRASEANLAGGESLTDIVVSTIGKVIAELTPAAAVRTDKGRKQIKRSLMILEQAVLKRLQTIAGKETSAAAAELLDDATESLDMDAMAAKFVKSRKAAEESGEKLRRLVARSGDDPGQLAALHETLTGRGLSEGGWQDLMISREPVKSAGGGDFPSGFADIKALTLLLAQLGETFAQTSPAPAAETLRTLAGDTHRHVETLAARTERKISALRQMLGQEGVDASGKAAPLSRRQLLELLAEIGQELSQPLTVVLASLDMLQGQRVGPLTTAQTELLGMASSSTGHLTHLVGCLIRISGNPKGTHPDKAILDVLYNREADAPTQAVPPAPARTPEGP
jgi:hypothetical protein